MKIGTSGLWLIATAAIGLFTSACQSGGIGDPCVPEDEYRQNFSGFQVTEVNVESRSFQCETRVCLVNHFQGRVSCPYGQSQATIDSEPGDSANRCQVPGTLGKTPQDTINVPVDPQLVNRQDEKAVYCSCRCNGPDKNARYCECPDGYSCTQLVDDLGLGAGQLAGSYCVRKGTKYDQVTANTGGTCLRQADGTANCTE